MIYVAQHSFTNAWNKCKKRNVKSGATFIEKDGGASLGIFIRRGYASSHGGGVNR